MIIYAFDITRSVNDEKELEKALSELVAQGHKTFELADQDRLYPMLTIAVNGDMATMCFLPGNDDPGFRSLGDVLDPAGESLFSLVSPGEEEIVPNMFVISYTQAVEAAKEFLKGRHLPLSIGWMDLVE